MMWSPNTAVCDDNSELMAEPLKIMRERRPFFFLGALARQFAFGVSAWLEMVLVLHGCLPKPESSVRWTRFEWDMRAK